MNVQLTDWRRAGCNDSCMPRQHDPFSHEQYGRLLEQWDNQPRIVRTGSLTVELSAHRVLVDGTEVHVSGREWEVLAYLVRRIGQWCALADIQVAVWGGSVTRRRPDLRPVNVTIHRLRHRLGAAGRLITSVSGAGRRLELEAPVPAILALIAEMAVARDDAVTNLDRALAVTRGEDGR